MSEHEEIFGLSPDDDDPGPPDPTPLSPEELEYAIFQFAMTLLRERARETEDEMQARYQVNQFLQTLGETLYQHNPGAHNA